MLTRATGIVVGGALCAVLLASADGVTEAATSRCKNVARARDGWSTIGLPRWPNRSTELPNGAPLVYVGVNTPPFITDLAVDPIDPDRIFVTDGSTVMRSQNGGCTWKEVFYLPGLEDPPDPALPSAELNVITSIHIPESRQGHNRIYMVTRPVRALNPYRAVHVIHSSDGGGSWKLSSVVAPTVYSNAEIFAAPSDPNDVFLVVNPANTAGLRLLFASSDGAESWSLRSTDVVGNGWRVDPLRPAHLWGGDVLSHSRDGGKTFRRVKSLSGSTAIHDIDLAHERGKPLWIVAAFDDGRLMLSRDDGKSFNPIEVPGYPLSVAFGAKPREMVLLSELETESGPIYRLWRWTGGFGGAGELPWRDLSIPRFSSHPSWDFLQSSSAGALPTIDLLLDQRETRKELGLIQRYQGRL